MNSKIKKTIYIKHWKESRLKKTFFLVFFCGLIVNLLFFLVGTNYINKNNEESLKNKTDIKYIIPSPSKNQMNELKAKKYVRSVNSTFYMNFDFVFNNKEIDATTLVIDSKENLNNSPYSEKRNINGEKKLKDDTVFIDYLFHKKNNININDILELKVNKDIKKYVVTGIYENNSLINSKNGSIIIYCSNDLISILNKNSINFKITNAYIDSTKEIETDFLKDYKAYGRLKNKSEFPTEEAYKIHYENFMKTNFSNEIVYLINKQERFPILTIILIINSIIMLFFSFYNIFFMNSENEKKFTKKIISYGNYHENKKKGLIFKYYEITCFLEILVSCLVYIIPTVLYYYFVNREAIYVEFSNVIIYLLSNTTYFVLSILINYVFINYVYKRKINRG